MSTLTDDKARPAPGPGWSREGDCWVWTDGAWSVTLWDTVVIMVTEPDREWSVNADEDALRVFGEWQRGYEAGGSTVVLPWPVLEAIMEARMARVTRD